MMKVIFAGTPDFAATALKALVKAGFEIPLVLTQPDRPKGRGMALQPTPVKQMAQYFNLPVAQPEKLRNNEQILALLKSLDADVMVVAAYGLILPESVLKMPKHGCLNIHASLLPRWRGAAPIQRAIEAGDKNTGVCIMQMDTGLDTGAIVSSHIYSIKENDDANDVHNELMHLGAMAIVSDLRHLQEQGKLNSTAQMSDGITYAAKLSKEEARIDWHESATVIERKIRAFNPVPTAWTLWQGKPLKIWRARIIRLKGVAGTILEAQGNHLIIACGEDALQILELQPSGSKRMQAMAFLAGRKLEAGTVFA